MSTFFAELWSNIWNVVGTVFWLFVIVAWIYVIFSIIKDVFTDDSLSGVSKALWTIFLIAFPGLTALIYLIVRGRGMGARADHHANAAQERTADYIRSVATPHVATELAEAKRLLDEGTISQGEFEQIKTKLLA